MRELETKEIISIDGGKRYSVHIPTIKTKNFTLTIPDFTYTADSSNWTFSGNYWDNHEKPTITEIG